MKRLTTLATSNSPRPYGKGLTLLLLVACVSLLTATTSATAGHNDQPSRRGNMCEMHRGGQCGSGCGFHQLGPYAQRQFNRGYLAGVRDSWEYGYYDGFYCMNFCDQPPYRVRRHSRNFVDGYFLGFASGYDNAYHKGKKQRHRGRGRRNRHRW